MLKSNFTNITTNILSNIIKNITINIATNITTKNLSTNLSVKNKTSETNRKYNILNFSNYYKRNIFFGIILFLCVMMIPLLIFFFRKIKMNLEKKMEIIRLQSEINNIMNSDSYELQNKSFQIITKNSKSNDLGISDK